MSERLQTEAQTGGDPQREQREQDVELARPVRTVPRVRAADALLLQRTAGNRAVASLLGANAAPAGRELARAPTQVRRGMREQRVAGLGLGDFAWTAAYEVEFVGGECLVTVRARIERDADVTAQQARQVRRQTRREFLRIWDNRFDLTDQDTGDVFPLRMRVEFVRRRPHVTIQLHSGTGTDNRRNWFVGSTATDRAHELGHQIAMYDEYVDATVVNRATAASPGIRTDHSIMGNYPAEGPALARARLRHGRRLARHIGHATGRRLRASYHPRTPPAQPVPAPAPVPVP